MNYLFFGQLGVGGLSANNTAVINCTDPREMEQHSLPKFTIKTKTFLKSGLCLFGSLFPDRHIEIHFCIVPKGSFALYT